MNLEQLYDKYIEYKYIVDKKEALIAVNKDGLALQYVKEQTAEICLAAVKQDGLALMYVNEQTAEICLAAVNEDGLTLRYIQPHIFNQLFDMDRANKLLSPSKHIRASAK